MGLILKHRVGLVFLVYDCGPPRVRPSLISQTKSTPFKCYKPVLSAVPSVSGKASRYRNDSNSHVSNLDNLSIFQRIRVLTLHAFLYVSSVPTTRATMSNQTRPHQGSDSSETRITVENLSPCLDRPVHPRASVTPLRILSSRPDPPYTIPRPFTLILAPESLHTGGIWISAVTLDRVSVVV